MIEPVVRVQSRFRGAVYRCKPDLQPVPAAAARPSWAGVDPDGPTPSAQFLAAAWRRFPSASVQNRCVPNLWIGWDSQQDTFVELILSLNKSDVDQTSPRS